MSRRRNSSREDLILLPWWVSVLLAGLVYWGAKYVLPSFDFPDMFLNPFVTTVSKLAPLLAGFFVLVAIRSLFRRIRIGWQFGKQKSVDSLNDLSWNVMIERTARRGSNTGNRFWGCSQYPRCRGLINL